MPAMVRETLSVTLLVRATIFRSQLSCAAARQFRSTATTAAAAAVAAAATGRRRPARQRVGDEVLVVAERADLDNTTNNLTSAQRWQRCIITVHGGCRWHGGMVAWRVSGLTSLASCLVAGMALAGETDQPAQPNMPWSFASSPKTHHSVAGTPSSAERWASACRLSVSCVRGPGSKPGSAPPNTQQHGEP